jgi:hypothetical protein
VLFILLGFFIAEVTVSVCSGKKSTDTFGCFSLLVHFAHDLTTR